jgi:hypothetical protein
MRLVHEGGLFKPLLPGFIVMKIVGLDLYDKPPED